MKALLLTLALLLVAVEARAAEEARISEIEGAGGTVLCAEQLDTASMSCSGSTGDRQCDPTDTNTYECNVNASGKTWFSYSDPPVVAESTVPMPAGNTITNVWSYNSIGGYSFEATNGLLATGARRLCIRSYQRFSSGFEHTWPDNPCERTKIAELNLCGDSGCTSSNVDNGCNTGQPAKCGQQFQSEDKNTYIDMFSSIPSDAGGNVTMSNAGDSISIDDCISNWCRVEQCVAGDLDGGGSVAMTFEGWVEQVGVGTPKVGHWTHSGSLSRGFGAGMELRFANLYRQGSSCAGTRYVSSALAAWWPTDTGQQIGAAVEVEGGGGPTIVVDTVTPSDATPAYNTAINVEVAFTPTDTTGTFSVDIDCENNGGWEDGNNTGASSPITVSSVCPYTTSGAQTIGVRVQDTGPTATGTGSVGVTVDAAPACSDSTDNDGDTYTDYPSDPGCVDANDASELDAGAPCDDGVDNDSDTFIDYPDDTDCTSPTALSESPPATPTYCCRAAP